MRKGRDNEIIHLPSGDFLGVNLGSDCVSEHEWGIKPIRQYFEMLNMEDGALGLARRTIQRIPEENVFRLIKEHDFFSGFCFNIIYRRQELAEFRKPHELFQRTEEKFATAWNEKSFGMITNQEKIGKKFKQLYDSFFQKDIAFLSGAKDGIGQNGGLVIAIASKIPGFIAQSMERADKEKIQTQKDFEATGIKQILEEAGKEYFALSPERIKGELLIWLNPREQQKYNYGWFTVEDLKLWAQDKGPVIMKNKR